MKKAYLILLVSLTSPCYLAFETNKLFSSSPAWHRIQPTSLTRQCHPISFSSSIPSERLSRRNSIYSSPRRMHQIQPWRQTQDSSFRLRMIFGIGDDNSRSSRTNNNNNNNSDPDLLLKMVEELTMAVDDVTPELINKMEKVEMALASFLEEKSAALRQEETNKPPPPSVPPPMGALYTNKDMLSNDLLRAEQALEKLRQRLRREEEALFQAEQILQRSMEEQNILRQAEEALQKSRDAAERRKADASRRNGMADAIMGGAPESPLPITNIWERKQRKVKSASIRPNEQSAPRIPRPTMELGSFFGRKSSQTTPALAPDGLPIIYNWIQEEDGSIRGNVKSSPNFADGATISTSAVSRGAKGGTIVTTASGSKYFLEDPSIQQSTSQDQYQRRPSKTREKRATQSIWFQQQQSDTVPSQDGRSNTPLDSETQNQYQTQAPEGVPSIRNWKVREDGGIAGLIYGSMNAQDGDYIETSKIATGEIKNGNVVHTASGSRYFLSSESADNVSMNILNAFKSLSSGENRFKGTITINNSRSNRGRERQSPEAVMEILENASPRSTFSLFDLFGAKANTGKQTDAPPPLPPLDISAPEGVPTLTGWKINNDGSLTGYVYGSSKIGDGNLVTTSPIANGERRQFQVVSTVTGSLYWLA